MPRARTALLGAAALVLIGAVLAFTQRAGRTDRPTRFRTSTTWLDALARLERYSEAERLFLTELDLFPNHPRARAGLAMLYRATGRVAESDGAIADLIRYSPTREGYDLAARLWTMFGEPARAEAARARAARLPG